MIKKIILFVIVCCIITGCTSNDHIDKYTSSEIEEWKSYISAKNNLVKLYQFDDNTDLYSSLVTVLYIENGEEKDLKKSLENNEITIDSFIKKMDVYTGLNDGGSVFFVSNSKMSNQKFYLAKCKSMKGIRDIFIDTDGEAILEYCTITK